MDVTYFRARKPGPESLIESTVVQRSADLFPADGNLRWTAGYLPVGAGLPDLVIAYSKPEVVALCQVDISSTQILAYLRVVGRARCETITERMRMSLGEVSRSLESLEEARVVSSGNGVFSLAPVWREILPEIVTIEVKVKNWAEAVRQASRNSIFAHRSFVALPEAVANRVAHEPLLQDLGVGLLSVSQDDVSVLRKARWHKPKVWSYYYRVAFMMAKGLGVEDAIRCHH